MNVSCAGARIPRGQADALLRRTSGLGEELVLLDADRVCGVDHLFSAVAHARRAFERGTNSSNTLGMEVILYASGERQISKAKRKMGLHKDTERVALVALEGDAGKALETLGLERDDSVLDCSAEKGRAFGIEDAELRTVGEELLPDLVLEKVAFVEVLKR